MSSHADVHAPVGGELWTKTFRLLVHGSRRVWPRQAMNERKCSK